MSPFLARRSLLLAAVGWSALAVAANAQDRVEDRVQDRSAAPTAQLDDVIVTGAPFGISARASTVAVDVLDEQALLSAPAATLGDALNGMPGVRSTSFSAGASRPVIRGLSGPRVQVLTNGLGMIDASALSPDHQVAADPGEARRIEVLRGPQAMAFGGSAIGGVVNVIDDRIAEDRPENGLKGRLSAQASSVDDGYSLGGAVTVAAGPLVFSLDAMRRDADAYDIPVPAESRRQVSAEGEDWEGGGATTLENSFVTVNAYGGGVSFIGDKGFVGLSVKRTDSDYGVPGHAHAHAAEDPEEHGDHAVTIGLEQTRWDARGEYRFAAGPFDKVRASGGYADYTHTEFEGDAVGTRFTSEGYEGRVELVQARRNGWDGAWGVQGLSKKFDAQGDEAYVPRTDITEIGAYTMHRLDRGDWGMEGGLRVDNRDLDSVAGQRDFTNVSASAGVFWKPNDPLFLGLSVSRNGRAPTEAELFAEGPHAATRGFEIGNADLSSEKVVSVEGTVHVEQGRWTGDLHLFHARYDGFIDLVPTGDEEDGLNVYRYVQTDATFKGLEAELGYKAWESGADRLNLELGYDLVRGDTDLGPPARIPPWSLTGRAVAEVGPWTVKVQLRHVAEQDRIAALELPTDAYTTADAFVSWSPSRETGLMLYADLRNLTDQEVREHASFLKDLAPLPGRNLRVGVAYRF